MTSNIIPRKIPRLRLSARGEECTLQIHPYCNGDPEKTVLCHLSTAVNSGMGLKPHDFFAVYGCSSCHEVIDGKVQTDINVAEIGKIEMNALYRTQLRFFEKGLIKI
jgi:hypothetical protein